MQNETSTTKKGWSVKPSRAATSTTNPIRELVDSGKYKPNPNKDLIPLSIGDPCVYGNLTVVQAVNEEMIKNINSGKFNGYPPSIGYLPAREAVAKFCETPTSPLGAKDVILASGASGAIEIALDALLNPGDNILLPKPGFSLYECICKSKGYEIKYYNLLPSKSWEADLDQIKSLIDDKTKVILINNPSNPCGSVYSKEHLNQILKVAEEHYLPIISDEIYAGMTFGETQFYPIASLTETVPVLSIGGIAKRFLVPGWRVGWICVHDRNNIFTSNRIPEALAALSTLILGPNSLVQSILPNILDKNNQVIQQFFKETNETLEKHSNLTVEILSKVNGLNPITSSGTMYQMIGIDCSKFKDISDDKEFALKLLNEESVFVLPGSVFGMPNFFRIVFCAPQDKLAESYQRIKTFCENHQN